VARQRERVPSWALHVHSASSPVNKQRSSPATKRSHARTAEVVRPQTLAVSGLRGRGGLTPPRALRSSNSELRVDSGREAVAPFASKQATNQLGATTATLPHRVACLCFGPPGHTGERCRPLVTSRDGALVEARVASRWVQTPRASSLEYWPPQRSVSDATSSRSSSSSPVTQRWTPSKRRRETAPAVVDLRKSSSSREGSAPAAMVCVFAGEATTWVSDGREALPSSSVGGSRRGGSCVGARRRGAC